MRHFFALFTLAALPLFGVPLEMTLEMTSENLEEILASENPVIVNVTLPGCGSCHQFSTVFGIVSEEFKDIFVFATLNSLKEKQIAINFQVMHVPTLLFIENGTVIARKVGPLSYDEIRKLIYTIFVKEASDDAPDEVDDSENDSGPDVDVDDGDEEVSDEGGEEEPLDMDALE